MIFRYALLQILLFASSYAIEIADKEFICIVLAGAKTSKRIQEIRKYNSQHESLPNHLLSEKLIDDGYNLCIQQLTDEDAEKIEILKTQDFPAHDHLVSVPITKYTEIEELTLSDTYLEVKNSFEARLKAFKRKHRIKDL